MSESQGTAALGSQVLADRYELAELLGRGGMAEVYRAHDRLLDRTVAVKIFHPRDEPGARRHSDDEAHALARLAHPGLLSIFDVGAVDDRPFLVMEFVEGTSLRARLSAGPLPVDQVVRIGGMLAEALAHAHDRGVVHRDVKPSNIMLDDEDVPHLTDFGIALLAGSPRVTSKSEIVGTPAYLAPEQVSGAEVGPPADVYALGLVLLECLSGELEYSSDSCLTAALSRLSRPPRIPDDLSPRLAGLLAAMTSAEAAARPTAAACALSLMAASADPVADTVIDVPSPRQATTSPVVEEPAAWWADEDRTAPVPAEPPVPVGGPPRSRLVAGSVAAVALLVVALALLLNAQQPLAGHPQAGAGGRAQSGPSAGTGTHHPAGSAGDGRGTGRDAHAGQTLVAKEHPARATASRTAAVPVSPNPRAPLSPPAATSPPAMAPPAATTTSSDPPTTTSSEPPSTTSASPAPPSASAATNGGTH